ncbi:CDP-glycerol glycerophosphotransferase family protein [Litchfieldia alkalitelluris]|uniref:CDP-glycerol glycerophosphotransferase family protein n=1 Tax=Litchfieldia alkalitelluris TaxID=304268 RepID=UPI001F19CFFC|nr:CDP-glycerol glycerophosphotransferase family protein [Litchfieldia alkalitelluris]
MCISMVRDLIIFIYLTFFKVVFTFFKLFPLKNKITFVVSFGDNSLFIYEELKRQERDSDIVFLYKTNVRHDFRKLLDVTAIPFESNNVFDTLKGIYHLATSKHIVVDNYYGFLAAVQFKVEVTCTQVWHASGALKKFGLLDRSNSMRSEKDLARFKKVYKNFKQVLVGSEEMAKIFMEAFNIEETRILRLGIPRTDLFYDKEMKDLILKKLTNEIPITDDKKVILYAPTYRDGQLDSFDIQLDLKKMFDELKDEYIVILRLHPVIANKLGSLEQFPNFAYDYSSHIDANELLLITDVLISDYSSIPFEFSLLKKPMIFYAYDLVEYKEERGLWDDYEEMVPGPVVFSTDEVISCIKENQFDLAKINDFDKRWNRYSTGNSSQRFVNYIFDNNK